MLDENRRTNSACWNSQPFLGKVEHVVPEPGFLVGLEFWKVKVGPGSLLQLGMGVVKDPTAILTGLILFLTNPKRSILQRLRHA